jgi:hypothetical protein
LILLQLKLTAIQKNWAKHIAIVWNIHHYCFYSTVDYLGAEYRQRQHWSRMGYS